MKALLSRSLKKPDVTPCKRVDYDRKLMALCKAGRVDAGAALVNRMIDANIELSHFTLSALLTGCIAQHRLHKSDEACALSAELWRRFVRDFFVRPNRVSFVLAMDAASRCGDVSRVHRLRAALLSNDICLSQLDWNRVLDALGRCDAVGAMLKDFDRMRRIAQLGDRFSFCSVLNALARALLAPQVDADAMLARLERIISEIASAPELLMDGHVFAAMVDALIKGGRAASVAPLWRRLRLCAALEMDANCFALLFLAARRSGDLQLLEEAAHALKQRHLEGQLQMSLACRKQLLSALGALGFQDRMWAEFEKIEILSTCRRCAQWRACRGGVGSDGLRAPSAWVG